MRDADDLLAGNFEVLTTTGKYFWIPTERVLTLEFHAPKRPRDLIWRRVSMSVDQGPDGDVYIPVIYAADETMTDLLRLGRETDWREDPDTPVRGIGQRLFWSARRTSPSWTSAVLPLGGRCGQRMSGVADRIRARRYASRRRCWIA